MCAEHATPWQKLPLSIQSLLIRWHIAIIKSPLITVAGQVENCYITNASFDALGVVLKVISHTLSSYQGLKDTRLQRRQRKRSLLKKGNSRFCKLRRNYSKSLCKMQRNSHGVESLRALSKFRKRKSSSLLVYVVHQCEIRHFPIVIVQ